MIVYIRQFCDSWMLLCMAYFFPTIAYPWIFLKGLISDIIFENKNLMEISPYYKSQPQIDYFRRNSHSYLYIFKCQRKQIGCRVWGIMWEHILSDQLRKLMMKLISYSLTILRKLKKNRNRLIPVSKKFPNSFRNLSKQRTRSVSKSGRKHVTDFWNTRHLKFLISRVIYWKIIDLEQLHKLLR